jgi:hypothetical protein
MADDVYRELTSPAETLPRLPALCATRIAETGEAVILRAGATGYWRSTRINTEADIHTFNEMTGATPASVLAMLHGSRYGWDSPGADPDRWDPHSERMRLTN